MHNPVKGESAVRQPARVSRRDPWEVGVARDPWEVGVARDPWEVGFAR